MMGEHNAAWLGVMTWMTVFFCLFYGVVATGLIFAIFSL